jgi:hypothetical protein
VKRHATKCALVIATLVVALGEGTADAGAAPSHLPACAYYTLYSSYWTISQANFKLVRSGTWTSSDANAAATETDLISPIRRPLHNKYALFVAQTCNRRWSVDLASSYTYDGLVRAGSEDLTGNWSAMQGGSSAQGPCHTHYNFTTAYGSQHFVLWLNTGFRSRARRFNAVVKVQVPSGLVCQKLFRQYAQFDFPALPFDTLPSNPVALSPRMLEKDRQFTLRFSGTAKHSETWGDGPGTAQFQLAWSGAITFKPTGCEGGVIATGQTFHRCYPG